MDELDEILKEAEAEYQRALKTGQSDLLKGPADATVAAPQDSQTPPVQPAPQAPAPSALPPLVQWQLPAFQNAVEGTKELVGAVQRARDPFWQAIAEAEKASEAQQLRSQLPEGSQLPEVMPEDPFQQAILEAEHGKPVDQLYGARPSLAEAFGGGVQRNIAQIQKVPSAFSGMASEVMGDQEGMVAAREAMEATDAAAPQPVIASLREVRDAEDLSYWFVEKLGEQAATIGAMAASGGTGAALASLVGRGTISAATGGAIGGYLGSFGLETAGVAEELYDASKGDSYHPVISMGVGAGNAALEWVAPKMLMKSLSDPGKSVLSVMGKTSVTEAWTELTQEATASAARAYVDPEYDFFSEENAWRLAESAAAGFVVGGTYAGAIKGAAKLTGMDSSSGITEQQIPKEELEAMMAEGEGKPGPLSWLRSFTRRKSKSDVTGPEVEVPPKEDVVDMSIITNDFKNAWRAVEQQEERDAAAESLADEQVPRYALLYGDGTRSTQLFTREELDDHFARQPKTAETKIIQVANTSLAPMHISANVWDLPTSSNDPSIIFPVNIPGVDRNAVLVEYDRVREQIAQIAATREAVPVLNSQRRNELEAEARALYNGLLKTGLRVVPPVGKGFYYFSDQMVGKAVNGLPAPKPEVPLKDGKTHKYEKDVKRFQEVSEKVAGVVPNTPESGGLVMRDSLKAHTLLLDSDGVSLVTEIAEAIRNSRAALVNAARRFGLKNFPTIEIYSATGGTDGGGYYSDLNVIELNVGLLIEFYQGGVYATRDDVKAYALNILIHELGHAVTLNSWSKLPKGTQAKVLTDVHRSKRRMAITKLGDRSSQAPREYGNEYYTSPIEHVTEQFVRYMYADTRFLDDMGRFYAEGGRLLKVWLQHIYNTQPYSDVVTNMTTADASFVEWMQYLEAAAGVPNAPAFNPRRLGWRAPALDNVPLGLERAFDAVQVVIEKYKNLMPADVKVEIDLMDRSGTSRGGFGYKTRTIKLIVNTLAASNDQNEVASTFLHEVFHSLEDFLTKQERAALVEAGKRRKVIPLETLNLYWQYYREELVALGYTGAELREALNEWVDKEYAAWTIESYTKGQQYDSVLTAIIEKILQIWTEIKKAIFDSELRTVEDVVQAFLRGELTRRSNAKLRATKLFVDSHAGDKSLATGRYRNNMQPDKVIQLENDLFMAVQYNKDTNGKPVFVNYRWFRKAPDAGSYAAAKSPREQMELLGDEIGYMDLTYEGPVKGWDIAFMMVHKRFQRRGFNTRFLQEVEKDLDIEPVRASGILLPDGYEFWKKRAPLEVRYHVYDKANDAWLSPNYVRDSLEKWKRLKAVRGNLYTQADREIKFYTDLMKKVPKSAWTDKMLEIAHAFKVWHGSPHLFKRFKISRIGTGEGNTAFGWGLYFAQAQAVAQSYRRPAAKIRLAGNWFLKDKPEGKLADIFTEILTELKKTTRNPNEFAELEDDIVTKFFGFDQYYPVRLTVSKFRELPANIRFALMESLPEFNKNLTVAFRQFRAIEKAFADFERARLLYLAQANTLKEPAELRKQQLQQEYASLLEEQAEIVDILQSELDKVFKGVKHDDVFEQREVTTEHNQGYLYSVTINAEPEQFVDYDKPLSQQSEYVKGIVERNPDLRIYFDSAGYIMKAVEILDAGVLLRAGIKGIKFLDGVSRKEGAGTQNFITFSDKDLVVEEINGKAPGEYEVKEERVDDRELKVARLLYDHRVSAKKKTQEQNDRELTEAVMGADPTARPDPFTQPVDDEGIPVEGAIHNIVHAMEKITGRTGENNPNVAPNLARVQSEAARIGWFSKLFIGLQQLAWRNPHINELVGYTNLADIWNNYRMQLQATPDERVRQWDARVQSDPRQANALNQLVFWATEMRYLTAAQRQQGVVRHPTPQELQAEATRLGMNGETLAFYGQIQGDFANFLNEVEAVTIRNIQRANTDPQAQAAAIAQAQADFAQMRRKPYFPMTRFGRWVITVRDPNDQNRVKWFSAYATEGERDAAVRGVYANHRGLDLTVGQMPEEVMEFMGLPTELLRQIAAHLPGLTPAQRDWIEQFQIEHAPENSFRRRWLEREGTPGYSMDAMRAYAHYFRSGSNYLARIRYRPEMQELVDQLRRRATDGSIRDNKRLVQIHDYMQKHLNYIMKGGSDWARFKALVAVWQLGGSVMAAGMNLTQNVTATLPFLSEHFGDRRALGLLAKNAKGLRGFVGAPPRNASPTFLRAREEAIDEGKINTGLAPELGAFAESNNLARTLAGTVSQRAWRNISYYSMWMFAAAEKYNREVAFKTAFELAIQNPNTPYLQNLAFTKMAERMQLQTRTGFTDAEATAYLFAKETLDRSQFNYAPYARAPIMQHGPTSAFLVFFSYPINMIYAMTNNPGAARMWLIHLTLYGLAGLPFADDINKMIRLLASIIFPNTFFDPFKEARTYVRDLTENTIFDQTGPDLLLHGISRYSFGIGLMKDGWGVPQFDASGNGSLGSLIPGFGQLMDGLLVSKKPEEITGAVIKDIAGAGFGYFFSLMQFLTAPPGSDEQKKWEGIMPRALKPVSRAHRYAAEGVETNRQGGVIAEFDTNDLGDVATLITLALGAQPRKLTEGYERFKLSADEYEFYKARRTALYAQYDYANRTGNDRVVESIESAIDRFNNELERRGIEKGLEITSAGLRQSLARREAGRELNEEGLPANKAMHSIYEANRRLFPGLEAERKVK